MLQMPGGVEIGKNNACIVEKNAQKSAPFLTGKDMGDTISKAKAIYY